MAKGAAALAAIGLVFLVGSGPSASAGDPVLLAAGDIASCSSGGDEATAAILNANPSAAVAALGDNAYESGTAAEYASCYGGHVPSWGQSKARTFPAAGNHDYLASADQRSAPGYFGYFGAAAASPAKGYYSYGLGSWHVVVLNSNCVAVGGCAAGSPQELWLRSDLAATRAKCVLAYWHHPRFSSGVHGSDPITAAFWTDLYRAGADVVLAGHDHDYERFAPQTPAGTLDQSSGIREFVVGTGGGSHRPTATVAPNSEMRNADTFGVLRLTLHGASYDWGFVPEAGRTFTDVGTASCHDAPDTNPPAVAVTSPAEGSLVGGLVPLAAVASDDVGVAKVDFFVDGSPVATDTAPPFVAVWDSTARLSGTASVTARATDAAGNQATSTPRTVAVDNRPPVVPPEARTGRARPLARGAVARGIVMPNGKATSFYFEYGRTVAYGSRTRARPAGDLGSRRVHARLWRLRPHSLYHFRLVATNADGTARGVDATFVTRGRR